ncbi:MAG: hypothetical protein LUQ61_07920 [Methanoregulaceae archaeon]|nr:hypothetical protein [Methanoregulaceae archaeon]
MTEKQQIIQELGESELLFPSLVNAALAANERVKYCFTLLQTAKGHAGQPDAEQTNLRKERESAGIDDPLLDTVVGGSRMSGDDQYQIPFLAEILSLVREGMFQMVRPFTVPGVDDEAGFEERLAGLLSEIPSGEGDLIQGTLIDRMTVGDRSGEDSLHLLVIDLHKGLNRLQARLSTEQIDGAMTYLLTDGDRSRVRAFMAGLNRTAPLRFGHPGLGTTATRSGKKLLIENDIGLTDAHVLVVTVEDRTVTVTYTDIHIQRLQFFQSLFEEFAVGWADTRSRSPGKKMEKVMYHLAVGSYTGSNDDELDRFLTFLGSRVVFLIDWNRARKRLRNFVSNSDAIGILRWAAAEEIGHVAFLELGGDVLIFDALELASRIPLRYGEPLHQILGREKTVQYLQFVLKTASRGLLSNTSVLLLKDEIRAELLQYFRSAQEGIMELCEEHISYSIEIGTILQDSLAAIRHGGNPLIVNTNAQRAKAWERRADDLVNRVRTLSKRIEDVAYFADLIFVSDDIADYLEEASFYTTLVPYNRESRPIHDELLGMSNLALKGCKGYLKALIAAQDFHRTSLREDMQEFLKAVDEVFHLERESDEALRNTERVIYDKSTSFKEFRLYLEIASNIEEATNSLMKAVLIIRDRMLESVNR